MKVKSVDLAPIEAVHETDSWAGTRPLVAVSSGGYLPAFPKPKSTITPKQKQALTVRVFRDGREVCTKTPRGLAEYKRRREEMYERDRGMCCICHKFIRTKAEATFEHVNGRGMGGSKRDDRIEGNGVAHFKCNTEKGSKSLCETLPTL